MRRTHALFLGVLAACGSSTATEDFSDTQLLVDFTNAVVVPTYADFADKALAFDAAVAVLLETNDDDALSAAKAAWTEMRRPWEHSEAFLFGPVDANGWDPAMDSWPLNKTDLEAVLASSSEFTAEFIASLPETQKGFHASEYLMWGEGGEVVAADLDERELAYLRALSEELVNVTTDLHASWVEGTGAYRDVFNSAGTTGNTAYPSRFAALQEIIGGLSGICDEVANGKIATPFDSRDPNLVESQFSYNSIADFADNIRGVQAVFNAQVEGGTGGRGLADWFAENDPALGTELSSAIDAAIAAIEAIPAPFSETILVEANDAAIIDAQVKVRAVQTLIDGAVWTALQE